FFNDLAINAGKSLGERDCSRYHPIGRRSLPCLYLDIYGKIVEERGKGPHRHIRPGNEVKDLLSEPWRALGIVDQLGG
ncbi:hypothetical protein, partial [Rhizobium leguminosarum]|uniref:hypothetical protein n=1 Tax=Rhizobium leguminosarum TaxID=384 RepID=UPI003F94CB6F